MGRFSELLAAEKEIPARREQAGPPVITQVVEPPGKDLNLLGTKRHFSDRLAAAQQMYPDAMVEPDPDSKGMTIRRGNGDVYRLEEPSILDALSPTASYDLATGPEGRAHRTQGNLATGRYGPSTLFGLLAAPFTGGTSLAGTIAGGAALGAATPVVETAIAKATPGPESTSLEELGKESAKSAIAGGAIAGGVHGGLSLTQLLKNKARDVTFNLRSLFGGEPEVMPDRALDALGVKPGSEPNKAIQDILGQKYVKAEKLPPSVLTEASPGAPEALARVSKHPRVQVAENKGLVASKRGLRFADETDAPDRIVSTLVDIRRGKLPTNPTSMGIVGDAIASSLKVARRSAGLDENLARAISDPATKAELLQIIAAGREPNLSADAAKALAARGLALLGVDSTQ